jgi:hypothetical protein
MKSPIDINDILFEAQFKAGVLDPAVFSHEAHLRLAWIHIKNYGVETAIENICNQLKAFVEILGAGDKYNETLTIAAIRAVHHFMLRSEAASFGDFIEQFPRLKYNFKDLMACHYKMDIFNNAIAKREYIAPDLLPF